jgi:hypothetical protein
VLPGDSVEVHIPVRAPAEPGDYTFAARMVHEGVELFGPTVSGAVTVAFDHAGSEGDSSHGGCSTGRGASWWLVLALVALRVRRRAS